MLGALVFDAAAGLTIVQWFKRKKQDKLLLAWKDTGHTFPVVDDLLRQAAGQETDKQKLWADRTANGIASIAQSRAFHYLLVGLMNKDSRIGKDGRSFLNMLRGQDQRVL